MARTSQRRRVDGRSATARRNSRQTEGRKGREHIRGSEAANSGMQCHERQARLDTHKHPAPLPPRDRDPAYLAFVPCSAVVSLGRLELDVLRKRGSQR